MNNLTGAPAWANGNVEVDANNILDEAAKKDLTEYDNEKEKTAKNIRASVAELDVEIDRRRIAFGLIPHRPDMSIIQAGQKPPPPFPYKLFQKPGLAIAEQDAPLTGFAKLTEEIAASNGCPGDYVMVPLLGACASLIGNSRRASSFDGNFKQTTSLWTANVGFSGAGKSHVLIQLQNLLVELEGDHEVQFKEKMREHDGAVEMARVKHEQWKADVKSAAGEVGGATPVRPLDSYEPDEPQRPRLMLEDVTVEMAAQILLTRDKGIWFANDELTRLIGNFGKYGGEDRSFYLKTFEGGPHIVDRKSLDKPIKIARLTCSLTGTITPDKLVSLVLSDDNDGFAARFLWVWPESLPPVRPGRSDWKATVKRLFKSLDALKLVEDEGGKPTPSFVPCDTGAEDVFQEFRLANHKERKTASGIFESFLSKRDGMALRIALVLTYIHWALEDEGTPEPTHISMLQMSVAIELLDGYFKRMAERVYQDAALPEIERNAAILAKAILKRGAEHKGRTGYYPEKINANDVRRNWRLPGLRKSAEVGAAIRELVDRRWLTGEKGERDSDSIGAKTKDFTINPRLWGVAL